ATLLASRAPNPVRKAKTLDTSPVSNAEDNSIYLRSFSKIALPILIIVSLVLLVRGHNEPGGGFVAALLTGAGFALLYLAAPTNEAAPIRWPYMGLISAGVALGAAVGVLGLFDRSFLTPFLCNILRLDINSSLIFDSGVYLAVLGLILGAFNMLGSRHVLQAALETPPGPSIRPPPGIDRN